MLRAREAVRNLPTYSPGVTTRDGKLIAASQEARP